jgi:hypothetical protein
MTASRNVEVRLSELDKLPVEEVDLLVLKQAGVIAGDALSAKVILSGKLNRKISPSRALAQPRAHVPPSKRPAVRSRTSPQPDTQERKGRSYVATQAAALGKTGKFGDLWRRLWFLLGALVVYRIGAHIPVPGIDPVKLG